MTGNSFRTRRILPIFLIPIGLTVYLYALRAPFVYDDRMYVTDNLQIRNLWNFANLSGTRYLGFLSFALNYRFSGLTPFDFHLVNVVIHIVNSYLVFELVNCLFDALSLKGFAVPSKNNKPHLSAAAGFAVALVFLVHPIQTQAVTYVTQRFTSLAALFYLASIVLYVKARLRAAPGGSGYGGAWGLVMYAASVISAVFAMKTKEISFTLPFAITMCEVMFFSAGNGRHKRFIRLIPFYFLLLIIPLTLLAQGAAQYGSSINDITDELRKLQLKEAGELSRVAYLLTEFRVVVTYMRLFFLPVGQSLDYYYPHSEAFFEAGTFFSFLALVALLLSAVYALRRTYAKKNPFGALYSFGIFWFFLTLSVESSIIPIQDVIFEHRVYLPSVGLIIALAGIVFYASGKALARFGARLNPVAVGAAFLIAAALPLSVAAYQRNFIWTDEFLLLGDAIAKNPLKARLYYARGIINIYNEMKRPDAAETQLATTQNFISAINDFTIAVKLDPLLFEAYNNRGLSYAAIGMHELSVEDFNRAVALSPLFFRAYYNRGISLMSLGRLGPAIADFTRVIEGRPGFADAYNNRAIAYSVQGDVDMAGVDLRTACGLGLKLACENLVKLKARGK